MFEIVSLFGLLISAVLFINVGPENKVNIYLGSFFLSFSLFALTRSFILFTNYPWVIYLLVPGSLPIFTLSAPLLYLYVKKSLVSNEPTKLSWMDSLHFIPMLVCFINISPQLFQSHTERLLFSKALISNQFSLLEIKTLLFPISANLVLRPLLGIGYVLASFMVFYNYCKSNEKQDKNVLNTNLPWFLFLISCMGLNYILSLSLSIYASFLELKPENLEKIKLLMSLPAIILFVLNTSVFFYPRVLYGFIKRKAVKKEFSAEKLQFNDGLNPLRNLLPDANNIENSNVAISRKLGEYFVSKPYLQPGFTLSKITQETNIPYHQLTIYYNNYLGINFNDWKNNARIDHAMDLIRSGRAKNLTLESIAFSCGFLSRSNFVNSFRKKTGLTPSEFLRSISKELIVATMDF